MGGTSSCEKNKAPDCQKNLRFYRNEIKSDYLFGYKIEEMLKWKGQYDTLEDKHDYIQWLFPIPGSRGINSSAQQLYEDEAKAIRDDDTTSKRVLRAYQMMLDFYGMYLHSDKDGTIAKSRNYIQRYKHLNRSTHNYRRITRILISLGELGFDHYQVPWVTFLMEEAILTKELSNLNGRCLQYWIDAIKDEKEREKMYKIYASLEEKSPAPSDEAVKTVNNDSDKHGNTHTNPSVSDDNSLAKTEEPNQELLSGVVKNSTQEMDKAIYLKDSDASSQTDCTRDLSPLPRASGMPMASFSNDSISVSKKTNSQILEPNCVGQKENENVHSCDNQPPITRVVDDDIRSTSPATRICDTSKACSYKCSHEKFDHLQSDDTSVVETAHVQLDTASADMSDQPPVINMLRS